MIHLPHRIPANQLSLWFKYTLLLTLLIVSGITCWLAKTGQLALLDEQLLGSLFQANEAFIAQSSSKAESMTLTLSELHAGLLVLQSSEFGISFFVDANIQLGNAIAQLTDMVSYGRNFALFNLVALHIIENLLELIQWLTPWLIITAEIGLLSIVAADTWLTSNNRWHMSLIRFGEGAVMIAVVLVLIAPLSVQLVNKASNAVTSALFDKSYQAVVDTHKHIMSTNEDGSIKESASGSLTQFKNVRVKLSEKSNYLATNLSRYVAVTVMEVFLLPVLFSLIMLWFARSLIRRHPHWSR